MNSRLALAALAALVIWPTPGRCQHMTNHTEGMGGSRRTSINLVSPADSAVQIARGRVMLSSVSRMTSGGSTVMGGMGAGSHILLALYGVVDDNGPVNSAGNQLLLDGRLTSQGEPPVPVSLRQSFAIANGFALVSARLPLSNNGGRATLLVDAIAVTDADGAVIAQVGVRVTVPSPQSTPVATPMRTPAASCHQDSDCGDGDSSTQDLCTPGGCMHMPGDHGGPGMMH